MFWIASRSNEVEVAMGDGEMKVNLGIPEIKNLFKLKSGGYSDPSSISLLVDNESRRESLADRALFRPLARPQDPCHGNRGRPGFWPNWLKARLDFAPRRVLDQAAYKVRDRVIELAPPNLWRKGATCLDKEILNRRKWISPPS